MAKFAREKWSLPLPGIESSTSHIAQALYHRATSSFSKKMNYWIIFCSYTKIYWLNIYHMLWSGIYLNFFRVLILPIVLYKRNWRWQSQVTCLNVAWYLTKGKTPRCLAVASRNLQKQYRYSAYNTQKLHF